MSDLPAGYTAYKIKKYDVSDEKKLVRVGLRLSKYRKPDGKTGTEEIDTFEGKYSFAALKMLHEDFCDPCCTFELLKKKYPLNKNASMDAYDTLLPWARKNHIFPDYPHDFTHLWFHKLYFCCIVTFFEYPIPNMFPVLYLDSHFPYSFYPLRLSYDSKIIYAPYIKPGR